MKRKLFEKNADFYFGIAIIIFSVTGYYFALGIKDAESAQMPKLILVFMAIMGLGISVSSVINRARGKDDMTKVSGGEILGGILLPGSFLVGAYLLIKFLGFYVAEFVLIVALMALQAKVTDGKITLTAKKVITTILFAVISMAVMYGIFHFIFALPTPKGIFGF